MKIASHLRELFIDENWSVKFVENIFEKISMIFVYKKWSYIIHSLIHTALWEMIKYQSRFLLLSIRNDNIIFLVSFLSFRRIISIFFVLYRHCPISTLISIRESLSRSLYRTSLSFSFSRKNLIRFSLNRFWKS